MIVIVSGTSASGKTELANNIIANNNDFKRVVTYTTRSIRPELEKNGVDYNFVSESEFSKLEDEGRMIESCFVSGNKYGSAVDSFIKPISEGKKVIFVCDPNGAASVHNFAINEGIPVTSIFLDVSLSTRIDRVLDRLRKDQWQVNEGLNPEVINKYVQRVVNMKTIEMVWDKMFNYDFKLNANGLSVNEVVDKVLDYVNNPILVKNEKSIKSVIHPELSKDKVLKIDSYLKKYLISNNKEPSKSDCLDI